MERRSGRAESDRNRNDGRVRRSEARPVDGKCRLDHKCGVLLTMTRKKSEGPGWKMVGLGS